MNGGVEIKHGLKWRKKAIDRRVNERQMVMKWKMKTKEDISKHQKTKREKEKEGEN